MALELHLPHPQPPLVSMTFTQTDYYTLHLLLLPSTSVSLTTLSPLLNPSSTGRGAEIDRFHISTTLKSPILSEKMTPLKLASALALSPRPPFPSLKIFSGCFPSTLIFLGRLPFSIASLSRRRSSSLSHMSQALPSIVLCLTIAWSWLYRFLVNTFFWTATPVTSPFSISWS